MAYTRFDFAQPDRYGLSARFQWLRESLRRHAAQRAVYRRTVEELQALSDRDLADLGMHRSDIPRIARQALEQA